MRRLIVLLAALLGAAFVMAPAAVAAPRYAYSNPAPGYDTGEALGVSDSGVVVGYGIRNGMSQAWMSDHGNLRTIGNGRANAISPNGAFIVGSDGSGNGLVWNSAGTLVLIYIGAAFTAVNGNGLAVGTAGFGQAIAKDVTSPGSPTIFLNSGPGLDVNGANDVLAGAFVVSNVTSFSLRQRPLQASSADAGVVPASMNELGEVVGESPSGTGVVWDPSGTPRVVPVASPRDINDLGDIVGVQPSVPGRGVLLTGGQTLALSGLIAGAAPAELTPTRISNTGYVVGRDGDGQPFVLSPSTSIDETPPVVECGAADTVWHATNVSVTCTASDAGSGLADPADASFRLSTGVAEGEQTPQAQTGTRQVCDAAGNCASAGPVGPFKVDRKAPVAQLAFSPQTAATILDYVLGQPVTVTFSCDDGADGSGVATCQGPVPSGGLLSTAAVNRQPATATVTASDSAGNTGSASRQYRIRYRFGGFLQPINDPFVDPTRPESRFSLGSKVGVRMRLFNWAGASVQQASAPQFQRSNNLGSCDALTEPEATLSEPASAGVAYEWEASDQRYRFNWDTKGLTRGEYRLYAVLDDGTRPYVDVCLR